MATGELERSIFRRSVVLLYEHSSRGARGVILSQPITQFDPRLASSNSLRAPTSSRALLRHFHGGPVGMLGMPAATYLLQRHVAAQYALQ